MLNGFNCTIFAYGQTGTGKTYTMSGDISDQLPIPDSAGIIPRVLHTLFARLNDEDVEKVENSVKCSFIELYNEELRDLLTTDDNTKLKIFDEANKNGRTTTLVQGMEETHIKTASKGIQLLREGSHKRQVAATKCNDLSSRSHTVFTVTVYMKRTSDAGEDFVSAGKLNLVDLAGSENIQRSGAENKRATEAGLINKSLLTLGRVINALVDKSSHIPYRESKLTRLLQDSLGGRTKTCIIATLSPAKSNLEETISTLDYAFRAKNIRNKPQVNQTVSKKTLLKEFTAEIEKLKCELIATRQRNGVYLTAESYEEITTESESRRILSEEQRDKIETMETNLRNKVQELFVLTTNFQSQRRDNEQTRVTLESTKCLLTKTEMVLGHTKRNLAEEAQLRRAHEQTEQQLAAVGEDLLNTLGTTTDHVDRLHSKLRRRSELHTANRTHWSSTQDRVTGVTHAVEGRIGELRDRQEDLLTSLSDRVRSYVSNELQELQVSRNLLEEKATVFATSESEVIEQSGRANQEINGVLAEIGVLREHVKQKVGSGLDDLSAAAQRISAGIEIELGAFHSQLQDSYVSLGREFKIVFEDLIKRMNDQQAEAERLRGQISQANSSFVAAGQASQDQLQQAVENEKTLAAVERADLLAKITTLINNSAESQAARIDGYFESASKRVKTSEAEYRTAQQVYGIGMDKWNSNASALIDSSIQSRDSIKNKLKGDWNQASQQTTKLCETTAAVHGETVRIVDEQMTQMDGQLVALDEIMSRVRAQSDEHYSAHATSLGKLSDDVKQSYQHIEEQFETSYNRTKALGSELQDRAASLTQTLDALNENGEMRKPLAQLRADMSKTDMSEYTITGETPARIQYTYPTTLPRTEAHETLLDRMRGTTTTTTPAPTARRITSPTKRSPSKPTTKSNSSPAKPPSSPNRLPTTSYPVFTDTPPTLTSPQPTSAPTSRPATATASSHSSLRELDVNVAAGQLAAAAGALASSAQGFAGKGDGDKEVFAGTKVVSASASHLAEAKEAAVAVASTRRLGRENVAPVGSGKGELGASVGAGGRRLRNRGS